MPKYGGKQNFSFLSIPGFKSKERREKEERANQRTNETEQHFLEWDNTLLRLIDVLIRFNKLRYPAHFRLSQNFTMSNNSAIPSSNKLNLCDSLFESLLYQIKASKLNYKIEESPFSAVIFLKRSLIKDKFGNFYSRKIQSIQI